MIVVIDYGMGNLRSVSKALETLGASVCVSSRPDDVVKAEKVILPGVGAFGAAMRELNARHLVEPIQQVIQQGTPYLGICLGLQLLFEYGEEGEGAAGLGVLKGRVKRFDTNGSLKIPHIGWNQIIVNQKSKIKDQRECPVLKGVPDQSFVYFVHSYYADPADRSVVAAETEYGARFTSMLWRDKLFATQFHPEKSQAIGLKLLENFIQL